METNNSIRSLLEMDCIEAKNFFLKQKSYCNFPLPKYFEFEDLLKELSKEIGGKKDGDIRNKEGPRNLDDINHTILHNKDGKLSWRPLQLTHPVLYVQLVHLITQEQRWEEIKKRFFKFRKNPKIECSSIPVESNDEKKDGTEQIRERWREIYNLYLSKTPTKTTFKGGDKAKQIGKWLEEIEKKSVELSLEYQFLTHTDISDCYGSIYTHSIAWALHGKCVMKIPKNRSHGKFGKEFIGNAIDDLIQDMSCGQTNGIPQGSVLMDFIAEIVLGYADKLLDVKLKKVKISNYQILRYRDDYRIFTKSQEDGEQILKAISETVHFLGMKLNFQKTKVSNEVIRDSFKADKLYRISQRKNFGILQQKLLWIHDFSQKHQNSGSLAYFLSEFRKQLKPHKIKNDAIQMIAITVDMAANNPRIYPEASSVISKLLLKIEEDDRKKIIRKIKERFELIPNIGSLQIWLQVMSHKYDKTISYSEPLCHIAEGKNPVIWNSSWIKEKRIKDILEKSKILNETILKEMEGIIPYDDIKIFDSHTS